jgi:hypothetical protein
MMPGHAPEQPRLVSMWLTLPPLIPPAPPQRTPIEPPTQTARSPEAANSRTRPVRELPETAPTTPDETTAPLAAPPESPSATPQSPAPYVDFAATADLSAKRIAAAAAAAEQRGDSFGPPPKVLAKPCVPKESSMEWKGEENPGLKWYGPIPILVTKRCVFTLGVFSCVLGDLPPANGHLFDDMKDPNRSRSSVPDPNICD